MREFLKSKMATAVLFVVLVVVGVVMARLLWQKHKVDQQIADLQARAERIRGQNQQLSGLINYLGTPQYQEKAAREQLNLKKDGEFVVGLPAESGTNTQTNQVKQLSNAKKWYYYFFKPDTLN